MTKNLTSGRPALLILLFAVPLFVGNVFQQLYGFADAFVVGRTIGIDALAAVGCTGGVSFLLLGFAWGMTSGLAIPTAQAFGAGDEAGIRRSVAAGAILAAATSAVIMAVAIPATRPLLMFLNTPAEILDEATVFLTVSFWGAPAIVAFNFLFATIRALGDSKTPVLFLVLSCVLNVGLVYVFVAVFGMGVDGAALATIVAQLASVLACLWLIKIKMPVLHMRRDDWAVTKDDLVKHLRLGLPMGFQMSIIAIGGLTVQYVLNGFGADAMAAYSVAQKIDGIAVAPLGSFGVAVATFTAQNYGAREFARIRRGVFQAGLMAGGFSLAIALVTTGIGPALSRMFLTDAPQNVVDMSHTYLIANGVLYVALAFLFILRNFLQGMGKTFMPTLAGVMELVGRVLAAVVLAHWVGYLGVCLAGPLAWVIALIPLIGSYLNERRELIREQAVVDAEHTLEAVMEVGPHATKISDGGPVVLFDFMVDASFGDRIDSVPVIAPVQGRDEWLLPLPERELEFASCPS